MEEYFGIAGLDEGQRGESNTPVGLRIRTEEGIPSYRVIGAGLDEFRLVLSLSGDSARAAEGLIGHTFKPRGMFSMRWLGDVDYSGFKPSFRHFAGEDLRLAYHEKSGALHVFVKPEGLLPVAEFPSVAATALERLEGLGLVSLFPVKLGRVDVTADVIFRTPALFRRAFNAVETSIPSHGRVVAPYGVGTVYLRASHSPKAKRLGRSYDKGRERVERGQWKDVPVERYLRMESENVFEHPRPELGLVTSAWARENFLDRFGYVGAGSLAWNGGLMDRLLELLQSGTITKGQYERMYTFLDHARVGMAEVLYDRATLLKRAREARELALEVPGMEDRSVADIEHEMDVRAVIGEMAYSL